MKNKINKMDWKMMLIIAGGVISLILLWVFIVQSFQNKAFALEEQVSALKSDIEVQELRKIKLIRNLTDCVKQYDAHEAETLMAIAESRGKTGNIENVTTALTASVEAYPELKSNENYNNLMNELSITENLLAQYRSNYNSQIKEYNRYVRKFPTRLFLNMLGYEIQKYTYIDYELPDVMEPDNLFED